MKWLIDEMLPTTVAARLVEAGHDARAVVVELRGKSDAEIFAVAVQEARLIVTENYADYVALLERSVAWGEPSTAVVFVSKAGLPTAPAAMGTRLATMLDTWAVRHPEPYPTAYWL